MRAEIRQILDPPRAGVGGQDASNDRDPSLDYYYSKLPSRGAGTGFSDPYAAPKNPRGTNDSSYASKKLPKNGQIPEPGAGWLVVAGAVGLILFGRRRAR